MIEDSDNGIRSALAAGCLPIGITSSFPRETLERCGAVFVAENFLEITQYLHDSAAASISPSSAE